MARWRSTQSQFGTQKQISLFIPRSKHRTNYIEFAKVKQINADRGQRICSCCHGCQDCQWMLGGRSFIADNITWRCRNSCARGSVPTLYFPSNTLLILWCTLYTCMPRLCKHFAILEILTGKQLRRLWLPKSGPQPSCKQINIAGPTLRNACALRFWCEVLVLRGSWQEAIRRESRFGQKNMWTHRVSKLLIHRHVYRKNVCHLTWKIAEGLPGTHSNRSNWQIALTRKKLWPFGSTRSFCFRTKWCFFFFAIKCYAR